MNPSSDASGLAPILDRQQLATLIAQTDQDTVDMVVEMFFSEALRYAENLQAARARADLPRLRSLAHSLKSSARQIGAARLADALNELEDAAKHAADGQALPLAPTCLALLAATQQVYREQGIWKG